MGRLDDIQLHYVETSEEAAQFVEWCKRPRYTMAVDTETGNGPQGSSLDRDARIRLIQFGDEDDAWTLRWDRWKGPALEALDLMKRARQRLSFHNAPFDAPKIERQSARDGGDGFKFDWGLMDDTMIMSRLAHPVGSHSLKNLCARLVDPRARAMQAVLADAMAANGWTWETVPYTYEGYTVYACVDTVLTARLLPEIEKMSFDRELYETEMVVSEACISMSEHGLAIDVDYCKRQSHELAREIDDILASAKREFRVAALGSNQICISKFHDMGEFWEKRTEKGAIALDNDVLQELIVRGGEAGRLAGLVSGYRTRSKLLNTYFRNFIEGSEEDGAVHCEINPLEAVTGRQTVTKPALHQIPRGPRARRAIVARPGHRLMLADFEQIEIRVLAHFCQDPALIEAIATGDVHTASAALIFQTEHVTPEQRQLSKSSVLSIIYGAGDEKFAHTAGVDVETGAAFMQMYDARFPHVRPWKNLVQSTGKQRKRQEGTAYVTTPAGRRLEMRRSDAEYTLVNYLCQGTAADIFKSALRRLWENGYGSYLRLPMHDEFVSEIPRDVDPREYSHEQAKIMEDLSYRVPMLVKATGPYGSWADKYDDPDG